MKYNLTHQTISSVRGQRSAEVKFDVETRVVGRSIDASCHNFVMSQTRETVASEAVRQRSRALCERYNGCIPESQKEQNIVHTDYRSWSAADAHLHRAFQSLRAKGSYKSAVILPAHYVNAASVTLW